MEDIEVKKPIRVDRPLTEEERNLTRWMLENGTPGAIVFLEQLVRARVTSLCSCGCASINFSIDGLSEPKGGLNILGDYYFGDETERCGAFVFEQNGLLSGLEVYGFGDYIPKVLPKPSDLHRY